MRQIRKTTAATIVGLGALALLASPSFAASSQSAGTAGAPLQLAHMGQGHGCGMGPGMMGPGHGYRQGPGCGMGSGTMGHGQGHGQGYGMGPGKGGQGMMGPGMMGPGMGGQGMMGPGMMGPGFGMGPGLGGQVVPSKDLSVDDVRHFLGHRLEMHGNKRLKIGEVKEADDDTIVADITTVDGSLVQRLEVDRHTGKMQHVE